jgi:hypothetical protein
MSAGATPGWFDDGTGTSTLRWWDGNDWTNNTVAVPPPVTPNEPGASDSVLSNPGDGQYLSPLEIANRGEHLKLDGNTLTMTFEGFTEQTVKKAASPRILPLTNIESVKYAPATTWKIGSLRVVIVGDSSPVRSPQFDINTVSIQAGQSKEAREQWDTFARTLAAAVAAEEPKTRPFSNDSVVPSNVILAGSERSTPPDDEQPDPTPPSQPALILPDAGRDTARSVMPSVSAAKDEKQSLALERKTEKLNAAIARKHAKQMNAANKGFTERHTAWESDRRRIERFLADAQSFSGYSSSSLMMKPDEREFTFVSANLIEERAGRANYVGGYQGVSIPIGTIGGRSVRYNVGASRGHVERAAPVDTVIDKGKIVVTNQRIVFIGEKQTREHLFSKLVGIEHGSAGEVTISVSNRQKATRIRYPAQVAPEFQSRIALALAVFHSTTNEYIGELHKTLQQVAAAEPQLQR